MQRGDTLAAIAQRVYGDPAAWRRLYEANREAIGPNPDRLPVGVSLTLGAADGLPPTPPAATAVAVAAPTRVATMGSRPSPTRPETTPQAGTPTPVAQRLTGPRGVPAAPPYRPVPFHSDSVLEERLRAHLGEETDRYGVLVKRLADGRSSYRRRALRQPVCPGVCTASAGLASKHDGSESRRGPCG